MKFIVTGADKKTGRDATLAIAAASVEEAERMATQRGMLVASVKPQPTQMATDVSTGALPIWGDDPADAAAKTTSPGPPGAPAAARGAASAAPQMTRAGVSLATPVAPQPAAPATAGAGTHESAPSIASQATPPPGARDSAVPASARYHVIQNPALYLLEAAVNKHMKEGWEPLGGIQVSYATNQLVFYQALVRGGPGE